MSNKEALSQTGNPNPGAMGKAGGGGTGASSEDLFGALMAAAL